MMPEPLAALSKQYTSALNCAQTADRIFALARQGSPVRRIQPGLGSPCDNMYLGRRDSSVGRAAWLRRKFIQRFSAARNGSAWAILFTSPCFHFSLRSRRGGVD